MVINGRNLHLCSHRRPINKSSQDVNILLKKKLLDSNSKISRTIEKGNVNKMSKIAKNDHSLIYLSISIFLLLSICIYI